MPRIKYDTIKFNADKKAIIDRANVIIADYQAQNLDLTLRQLYYQFVSKDAFPDSWKDPKTGSTNNEKSYDKLGIIITNGRMAGLIDWGAIVDRTRHVRQQPHWSSPQDIVNVCAAQFAIDKWARQPNYVEVWIEKDALLGVVEGVCQENDVPYMACRGYASASEVWRAGYNRFRPKLQAGKHGVVLYLGDHDPSGMDMPRDLQCRLDTFTSKPGGVKIKRLALNIDQVELYDPPPNPTKVTDSRAAKYIDEFGQECWELDALDPIVIRDLISAAIEEYREEDLWQDALSQERAGRQSLKAVATHWDDVIDYIPSGNDDEEDNDEE